METKKSSLTISLENVRLYGYHGVFPQEKVVGAEFEVSIDIVTPVPEGCASDSLKGTISYADIYDVVLHEFNQPSALIEHVAGRISTALRQRWSQIESLCVRVRKLSPPIPGFQGTASVTLCS